MSKIDIESMTTEELRSLNKRIIEVVNGRLAEKREKAIAIFRKRDLVVFKTIESGEVLGQVKRVNKKTLTVVGLKDYCEYLIPPQSLRKATESDRDLLA